MRATSSERPRLAALGRTTSVVLLTTFASLGAAIAGAAGAVALPTTGAEAYARGCASCHSTGSGGAPKVGDHAAWGLRIAQGKQTLYRHSLAGKGGMPARGGTVWPDATIRLAVDYMVELNK